MDRNPSFNSGAINARTHPEFFRPPKKKSYAQLKASNPEFFRPAKGEANPTQGLGDLENAQIVRRSNPVAQKPQKGKVIKPGTILP